MVSRFTLTTWYILSVETILSSKVATTRFLEFVLHVQPPSAGMESRWDILIFDVLVSANFFIVFRYKCIIPIWSHFLRDSTQFKKIMTLITSFVWDELHIQTICHWLYLYILMRTYVLLGKILISTEPETKSIFFFSSGFGQNRYIVFSFDGIWYSKFLTKLMNAVHELHLFSTAFLIPEHQNWLFSTEIFVEQQWPKCSASITQFCSFLGTTTLLSENNSAKRSIS